MLTLFTNSKVLATLGKQEKPSRNLHYKMLLVTNIWHSFELPLRHDGENKGKIKYSFNYKQQEEEGRLQALGAWNPIQIKENLATPCSLSFTSGIKPIE